MKDLSKDFFDVMSQRPELIRAILARLDKCRNPVPPTIKESDNDNTGTAEAEHAPS